MARHLPIGVVRLSAMLTGAGLALAAVPAGTGWAAPSDPSPVQEPAAVLSPGRAFIEADGASLYANVCQGCHMPDGRGASGAATYPSLVDDGNLRSAPFAISVVLAGLNSMPPIGRSMTDDQVAAVVNYVRGRFGNASGDPVTRGDVNAMRGLDGSGSGRGR